MEKQKHSRHQTADHWHLCRMSFTLVELLIVIMIIAILAGMLLPALNSVGEKARQAGCSGNLKQVSTATLIYTGDYSDYIVVNQTNRGYDFLLRPYLGYPSDELYISRGAKRGKVLFCQSTVCGRQTRWNTFLCHRPQGPAMGKRQWCRRQKNRLHPACRFHNSLL